MRWLDGITNSQSLLKLMSIKSVMPATISSSVILFSSCPQSFLASGSFKMSWFFASNGQSIGCLASASVLPMNYSGLISFAVDWFDHLAFQGTFRVFSPGPQFENISSSALSLLYDPAVTSVHDSWKNHSLTIWTFVGKVISLLFKMLSRFVIALLTRSKCLLISWL